MPIVGTPISSDLVSTSFDADGNRVAIVDVALLHNRDSGSRIAADLLDAADHHNGVGKPTTDTDSCRPTVCRQRRSRFTSLATKL